MTVRDVIFAVAEVVAVIGFVGLVLGVCWLVQPVEVGPRAWGPSDEPAAVHSGYRIVRRPFDWSTHPDL